jgi:D-lactate dehydrogenase
MVAVDVALRRNDENWFERLPEEIERSIVLKIYYGHFFCHVFHQDYIIRKGHRRHEVEQKIWKLLEARRAEFPAEHSFGHLYRATSATIAHYKNLDACNCFNPGIGHTSKSLR